MCSLNVCRLCCILICSALLLLGFEKKRKEIERKFENKYYLCLRRKLGENRGKRL